MGACTWTGRARSTLGVLVALAASSVAAEPTQNGDRTALQLQAAPVRVEGKIHRGDSLSRALARHEVGPRVVHIIAREMAGHFDFRRSRPGHRFVLLLDSRGEPAEFRYLLSPTQGFRMRRVGTGYVVARDEVELVERVARLAGVVTSSLYDSVRDLGAEPQLAADFADIFAWDLDFSRSLQPGDSFKILYERLYLAAEDGSEEFVQPGRILAAEYEGSWGTLKAVYFEREEGRGGYYRPDGTSVERTFLRAPLRYGRISSRFSSARKHPILKITRPHYGIDYAARSGTPVWSVGDGEIIYLGRAGGFGNLVKVRHARGYVSYYSHLARFPKGLRVGDRVSQKQLVGYVGQTGLATGPHVCFRMTHNGRYIDPLRVRVPEGRALGHEVAHLFEGTRDILLAELDGAPWFAVDEAL